MKLLSIKVSQTSHYFRALLAKIVPSALSSLISSIYVLPVKSQTTFHTHTKLHANYCSVSYEVIGFFK
jgi:hypothetical protein